MRSRIREMFEYVDEPYRMQCLRFIQENQRLFDSSKGSAVKHQAWPGGYRDHVQEVMEIALLTYSALIRYRPLPFSLSDALYCCFLHDIEKVWKHALREEDRKDVDKYQLLRSVFTLTDDHWNAIRYAHGEGGDYHPTERVQKPLAAFVHHCDNTSARIWFDHPYPGSDQELRREYETLMSDESQPLDIEQAAKLKSIARRLGLSHGG